MGYAEDAYTIASHFCLSGALGVIIFQLMRMFDGQVPTIAIKRGLVAGFVIFAWGLMVERVYYVAARMLHPLDLDLWRMHPAPEVLSFLVFLTLYPVKLPLYLALYPTGKAHARIATEIVAFVALWVLISVVLY